MNGLTRYNPVRELSLLRREMDRLFNDFLPTRSDEANDSSVWMPRADLAETDDAFELELDLPGVPAEAIEVTLEDDTLTVSGERRFDNEHKDGRFHRVERTYGRFFRTIRFSTPVDAEGVEASFGDGVLTVHVPKAEASKPRRIEIRQGRRLSGDGSSEATSVEVNASEAAS